MLGHDFTGWNTKADGTGESANPGIPWVLNANASDNVLFAQWEIRSLTVTFDTGAGSRVAPQRVTWGEKTERPGDPSYKGRTFEGWVNAATGVAYDFDEPVTDNLTLRAIWGGTQVMHRLYNPNSGEHFYTASETERYATVAAGWNYEGVGWVAPLSGNSPVYRLYNANVGDHHYTINPHERDALVRVGWVDEGVGWLSAESSGVAVWREYNPNAICGAHNFTTARAEHLSLVRMGWRGEGIAWFGV